MKKIPLLRALIPLVGSLMSMATTMVVATFVEAQRKESAASSVCTLAQRKLLQRYMDQLQKPEGKVPTMEQLEQVKSIATICNARVKPGQNSRATSLLRAKVARALSSLGSRKTRSYSDEFASLLDQSRNKACLGSAFKNAIIEYYVDATGEFPSPYVIPYFAKECLENRVTLKQIEDYYATFTQPTAVIECRSRVEHTFKVILGRNPTVEERRLYTRGCLPGLYTASDKAFWRIDTLGLVGTLCSSDEFSIRISKILSEVRPEGYPEYFVTLVKAQCSQYLPYRVSELDESFFKGCFSTPKVEETPYSCSPLLSSF
jgi:hypothetical protein